MKIRFAVDRVAAFKLGVNTYGDEATIDVDPAALSDGDRELLAGRLANSKGDLGKRIDFGSSYSQGIASNSLLTVVRPTLEGVIEAIQKEDEVVRAKEAAEKAKKAQEAEEVRRKTLDVLTGRVTEKKSQQVFAWRDQDGLKVTDDWSATTFRNQSECGMGYWSQLVPAWPYYSDATVKALSEVQEWLAELAKFNEAARAKAVESAARSWDDKQSKEAANEAAKHLKFNQIDAWVKSYGTDDQKARHAEGLLPEKEVLDVLRNEAFAPLASCKRYERITSSEFEREVYEDSQLECETLDPDEFDGVSAETYRQLVEFRGLMPGATVMPKLHRCEFDGETVERFSLHVAVTVGVFNFSREYAV